MRILFDISVVLDFLFDREPFSSAASGKTEGGPVRVFLLRKHYLVRKSW